MLCPSCKEEMLVLELNQVEIDYCQSCEGIWLDAGELELLYEDTDWSIYSSFTDCDNSKEKKKKCPLCRKKMAKITFNNKPDIILDKCINGDGIWFDKNELNKVLSSGNEDGDNKIVKQLKSIFEYKNK